MKAISLTQPWASAVALGIKQWEMRSWPTRYRGPIAIHAATRFPGAARAFALRERVAGRLPEILPRGAIVCVGEITECRLTEQIFPGEVEALYGDFQPGRYAFKLENVRPLRNPVPCNGALSLWEVPPHIWRQVVEGLKG